MSRVTLARGARNRISPGALSGSGRPSDSVGSNGNTYYRTDTGWTYTKSGGSWAVTSVPTTTGSTVLPFASPLAVYVSPYLANDSGGNIYGNVYTHGKTIEDNMKLSLLDATPSLTNGADGTPNFATVASPTNAAKKAHKFRAQKADNPTAQSVGVRTMVRFGDQETGTHNGQGLNLVEREWRAFAFSIYLDTTFKDTAFNRLGSGSETRELVLWQIHDAGQGINTPMIALYAYASWASKFYTSNIPALPTGDPPRLTWDFHATNTPPASNAEPPDTYATELMMQDFTAGEWLHFAGRFYLAPTTGDNPKFEVWAAVGSGAPTKHCNYTGINSCNQDPAYGGIGDPYKPSYGVYYYYDEQTLWKSPGSGGSTELLLYYGDYYMSGADYQPTDQEILDAIAVLQARHQ